MKTIFSGSYLPAPHNVFDDLRKAHDQRNDKWADDTADAIKMKFNALKITGTMVSVTVGATTTTFEFAPHLHIRMSRLRNIEDDISIAVGAKCRVICPLPDSHSIGIEVPTKHKVMVGFGVVWTGTGRLSMELPITLGIQPNSKTLAFDLTRMPHLLVAGASGQGKSVGLNVIIMSLLSNMTPRDLNLYLVDPKRVEFSTYQPLMATQMLKRINTDVDGANATLEELCAVMDKRYKLLSDAGVRKLSDYNTKVEESERLPYVVCIIDEFSDLMMSGDGKDVERNIVRVAQLGRAAGVHLIIATQRPDADVITGLIKANFPARIAFRTATSIDSKIILDRSGAQQLVGNGDALFSMNGSVERFQCAYVSDAEIERAVNHCVAQLDTLKIEEMEEPEDVVVVEPDYVAMAKDPNTPTEVLSEIYALFSDNHYLMRILAQNPNCSDWLFDMLSKHKDSKVRYEVAFNSCCPCRLLGKMRETDPDVYVRWAAMRVK